jgi:hypothetical protein
LRYAGEETFDGRPHHVVIFAAANGVLMSLFLDSKTNLLSKYEQMVTDPVDGDVVQETIYPGYRAVEKLLVPTGRQTRRGGDLIEDVKYTEVRLNTKPAGAAPSRPSTRRASCSPRSRSSTSSSRITTTTTRAACAATSPRA